MKPQTTRKPAQPIKLFRFRPSGHCHRVELFISLLGLPIELIDVDVAGKAQKTPEFLAMNAFGQLPVIQDGNVTLADSNAILIYLNGTYGDSRWLPQDPLGAAEVQRWLSVAAGLLAFGPAAARAARLFNAPFNADEASGRAMRLFDVMERVLAKSPYLAGATPTLADIANYSYIAHAPEGGISLTPYPHLRAWLAGIEALPGFVPMVKSPVPM
jgi:glutathione S-transferase